MFQSERNVHLRKDSFIEVNPGVYKINEKMNPFLPFKKYIFLLNLYSFYYAMGVSKLIKFTSKLKQTMKYTNEK